MIARALVAQTLLSVLTTVVTLVHVCFGQTLPDARRNEAHGDRSFTKVGVKECAACHSHPSPIYEQLRVTSFVRLREAKEWLERDKHAVAYKIVRPENNALTREICANLGWPTDGAEFATNCLTCHAGVDHLQPKLDTSTLQFGVQCESCHGAASEWTKLVHHQQESWRAKSPEEKSRLGMTNLRSPSTCAEVCFSCHIGDIDQNRFVTHAMYAAGHPPLPPVELQSLLDALPPHWKSIAEKPIAPSGNTNAEERFALEDEYYRANFGPAAASAEFQSEIRGSLRRSQTSLLGGLVAHKVGLELIRDAAERETLWGDYALYDCAACHHELVKPSTRPLDVGRTPGRPFPATWWILNTETLSSQTISPQRATATIFSAFDKTPFGEREVLANALRDVFEQEHLWRSAWGAAERRVFTTEQARAWLQSIVSSRFDTLADFSTARQTGWFVQVAAHELVDRGCMAKQPTEKLLEELSAELQLAQPQTKPPALSAGDRAIVNPKQDPRLAPADDPRLAPAIRLRSTTFNPTRCRQILSELLPLSRQ